MYDDVVLSRLYTCIDHIEAIEKYFLGAQDAENFFKLNGGVQYDATLMRLQALGESLKRISNKNPSVIVDLAYPEIDNVIRFRDYVSHHYEQLEHDVIFDICAIKIPQLKARIIPLIQKHTKN